MQKTTRKLESSGGGSSRSSSLCKLHKRQIIGPWLLLLASLDSSSNGSKKPFRNQVAHIRVALENAHGIWDFESFTFF